MERHAISELLVAKLKVWRQPGFSAFVGKPIPPQDKAAIEDIAAYLVRPPLSLEKLVYLDGERAVLYRSKMNLALGRNFEAMDPLEWLARMADHIPDPENTGHSSTLSTRTARVARGSRSSRDRKLPRNASDVEQVGRV